MFPSFGCGVVQRTVLRSQVQERNPRHQSVIKYFSARESKETAIIYLLLLPSVVSHRKLLTRNLWGQTCTVQCSSRE